MQFKFNNTYFVAIILNVLISCLADDNCSDEPVTLNERFISCCKGRPKYTSESCIDSLLANDTFSEECLVNCMYSEFKIYDGTTIDLAAVKTFLDTKITNAEFNLMYNNAFETCKNFDKNSIQETFSFIQMDNIHDCDVYPIFIEICIWYHTLANCPQQYATNDETCSNKSEWVNKCLLKI